MGNINLIVKDRAIKIGSDLRRARTEKQLTLEEVSNTLKIRKFYLEKIEEGGIENIPGIAYQRLYLKSYCNFLEIPLEYAQFDKPANENVQESESKNPVCAVQNNSKCFKPSKYIIASCIAFLVMLILFLKH